MKSERRINAKLIQCYGKKQREENTFQEQNNKEKEVETEKRESIVWWQAETRLLVVIEGSNYQCQYIMLDN